MFNVSALLLDDALLKCVFTEVVLFSIVALKTLHIQWRRNEFESVAGFFFWSYPPPFFGCKSTISCFGERFRDGQYSLVSFLFAVLLYTCPPYPMESAPLCTFHKVV